jgi:hypothetical protein
MAAAERAIAEASRTRSTGAPSSFATCAVEEAHHALYDRHIRALRAVAEERGDQVLPGEENVEVAPGTAGGQGVV